LSAVAEIASEVQALPGVWAVEVTDGASGGSPLAEGTMSSPMIAWLATEPAKFQQDLARVTARMNAFTGTEARPALQQKE
jgi:hypothetical protein